VAYIPRKVRSAACEPHIETRGEQGKRTLEAKSWIQGKGAFGRNWKKAAKEIFMASKKASRRKFLKAGAAAAAVGAMQTATGQAALPQAQPQKT